VVNATPAPSLDRQQSMSVPPFAVAQVMQVGQGPNKLVEPYSGLRQATGNMLRQWEPLTLFLGQPGAPLGNNI
jgi:transposase